MSLALGCNGSSGSRAHLLSPRGSCVLQGCPGFGLLERFQGPDPPQQTITVNYTRTLNEPEASNTRCRLSTTRIQRFRKDRTLPEISTASTR